MVVIGLGVVMAVWLLLVSGAWWLWCAVFGAVWPTGPAMLVSPPWLLFIGVTVLVTWLGHTIFGSR